MELPRRLGLLDCVALMLGTMIGSGIFVVPNLVARQVDSPWAMMAVWTVGGLLSLAGALSFGELAAMFPASGGQYVYIRHAFGELAAFLSGWTLFLTVITAAEAWLATMFAMNAAAFLPLGDVEKKLVAIGVIAVLTAVNYRGALLGALVQKVLTVLKVGSLLVLIVAALESPVNHWNTVQGGPVELPKFGLAMVAVLLTYDSWAFLGFVAGEVKQPQRNLPWGMALGLGGCMILYLLANYAYLKVLPVAAIAGAERVGEQAALVSLGPAGSQVVTAIVLLSILGSINGVALMGPRLLFAQAKDGLFFRRFAEVHPRYLTPGFSIVAQGGWSALLCVTGTYETLGTYAMFAAWLGYGITVVGLLVLRRTRPELERPYKVWAYPVLPAVFVLVALAFVANTIWSDWKPALAALGLIACGAPVYWYWKTKSPHSVRE